MMNDIGKQISKLRKNKGYTQEALAGILNVSPQAISKWENGRSLPETALLPILSKLFGCSIDSILMPQSNDDTNILRSEFDKQTESIIKKVEGMFMNHSDIGLSDEQIIRALCKAHGNIENCNIHRAAMTKSGRSMCTKIAVATPIGDILLIEKSMFRNDNEIHRLVLLNRLGISMPKLYAADIETNTILVEDLSDGYIAGFVSNENNQQGEFYRRHLKIVLSTVADLHLKCWDNHNMFEKTGLPWHLDNFGAHINGVEKDYNKFKKEYADKFDSRQIRLYEKALSFLKSDYSNIIEDRFHKGKNITVIHGDFHPGNTFLSKNAENPIAKMIDFEAVRMGLATDDLAMFLGLHCAPGNEEAMPLLRHYYETIIKQVKGYSFDDLISDYTASLADALFYLVKLINSGIPDFEMAEKALSSYESFLS